MSNFIPTGYDGREQALVKHSLLKTYLEKLVRIIGASARRPGQMSNVEICYVDCFAGPWSVDDSDELEGTSISISLQTLAFCKQTLANLGVTARMRALYVEKDASAFKRLEAYLAHQAQGPIEVQPLRGDFVDLRTEILSWCGAKGFAFFFVDPKGWKDIGVETMRPLLQRPRSEFLINFAYNFINRAASIVELQQSMVRLLGESIDLQGLTPIQREIALVDAYSQGLKRNTACSNSKYLPRTAYVAVLDPQRKRTKYHLIYLTTHPIGIIEFMNISEGVESIQRRVRASKKHSARERDSGTADMFGAESLVDPTEGLAAENEVDAFWGDYLGRGPQRVGTAEFADILESTKWFPSDLQASLLRLIKQKELRNLDADTKSRSIHPLHFKKSERLELIKN